MSILSTLRLRGRRIIGPLNGGVAVIAMACRSGCGCGLACRWWPGSWVFRVVGRRGAGGRTQPTVTALTGLADHPADDARFELAEPRQCGVRRLSEPLQSAGLCQSSQGHARRFKKRHQHNEPGRDIALAISQNVVCVDLMAYRNFCGALDWFSLSVGGVGVSRGGVEFVPVDAGPVCGRDAVVRFGRRCLFALPQGVGDE